MTTVYRDLSDPLNRGKLVNHIRGLRGVHGIKIQRFEPNRSNSQNAFYWATRVKPFADMLRESGDPMSEQRCHELIKHKFLQRSDVDPTTGEVFHYTQSTTKLTKAEFSAFLEQLDAWLIQLGVEIPVTDLQLAG